MQDFESAKAFLQQANSNGKSLYDHLTSTLLNVVNEKPANAVDDFEQLSVAIKNAKLSRPQLREVPVSPAQDPNDVRLLESIRQTARLCKPSAAQVAAKPSSVRMPDLLAEARLLERAGVSLGEETMYKLLLSIQAFARDTQLQTARFWGKILGRGADYYVCEARLGAYVVAERVAWYKNKSLPKDKTEPLGTGLNEYVYFAATDPNGPWTPLPPVRPEQIVVARRMRRFFTGDLSAPVHGYPRFPWPEASYLRAQIARITGATAVSPKGYYTINEGDDDDVDDEEDTEELAATRALNRETVIPDAEFEEFAPADLTTPDAWCHHRPFVLTVGRVTQWEDVPRGSDEEDEEEEEEEEEKPEEELEEGPELLRDLEADVVSAKWEDGGDDAPAAWSFRVHDLGTTNSAHAVVSARSLLWPGAVAVAKKTQCATIYVGYGQKFDDEVYTPPPPPQIQDEFSGMLRDAETEEMVMMAEQQDPLPPDEVADKDDDDEGDEDDDEDDEDDY